MRFIFVSLALKIFSWQFYHCLRCFVMPMPETFVNNVTRQMLNEKYSQNENKIKKQNKNKTKYKRKKK